MKRLILLCLFFCLMFAGCREEKQETCLRLSVEPDETAYAYYPGAILNAHLNPGMDFQYIRKVKISVEGRQYPLEQALRDSKITVSQLYVAACEDANKGVCTVEQISQNGVINNMFVYPEYRLNIVNDFLEHDDQEILVSYLAISTPSQIPNTIDGWNERRSSPRVKEDWGMTFEVQATGEVVNARIQQSGGMQKGELVIETVSIMAEYPFMLPGVDGIGCFTELEGTTILSDGETGLVLDLCRFLGRNLEQGDYTLRMSIKNQLPPEETFTHETSQYYNIPFHVN